MKPPIAPRAPRGRPRLFDRDQAVELAMRLFWRHGFEGVSIGDLTRAIGIAAPSLYAAFGSKAALYREALDRYGAGPGAASVLEQGATLEAAVEALLRRAVQLVVDPARELGCMVSSGLVECAPEHRGLAAELAARRLASRRRIARALERWLSPPRAEALAATIGVLLQGLSVSARDGATRADLDRVVDELLPNLVRPPVADPA